ncbi:hypothetical protein NC653_025672 [Populus alba x Populus x berolinensis]|uniref:Uncharacterized protein n=1 Tax=Populus alba x Populus x berolinensis TaxID=444605 RepID=A0AAD6MBT2_9ROSI|nr:hypothetical protein NC653_025672 [Populus alba x Populus x berolinensis]
MEVSSTASPRMSLDQLKKEGSEETHLQNSELESSDFSDRHNHQFHSMSALEILRETVRILRCNSWSFMTIAALLICPVSAILLSNVLVDQSIVKKLSIRLLLVAKSSGLPLRPFIKQSCHRFSEMAVSSAMCFPLFITLSLLSRAAVVYSVDCTYSKKNVDGSKFLVIISKNWRRVVSTYLWSSLVIVGCLTLFCVLLLAACSTFSAIGFWQELNLYAAIIAGLAFSVVFANAIIICKTAVVVCMLEDVSGPQALLRSSVLIRGQTQVGLLIFLGSTIGMAMIEGLFEHRVKTLSYGDGSSRIWEGPLLVVMHSFVVLIDLMMSAVFYYSCRSYNMETSDDECQSILEAVTVSAESAVIWKSSRAQPSSIRTSFSCCIQCFYLLGSLLGGKGLLALVFDLLRHHIPSQHACSSFQDPPDGSNMSFITLNHGVSFIFGWTGYPSVDKQGMPFVNIKEGKKTRVIITSQISSSRYPYFRCCTWIGLKKLYNLCFPVAAVVRGIMMDSNIQEKVHKVEEFFDGHLKPQLVRAIAERDKLRFVKEHRELREEQRTMVNLGSVLYMQVDVPDTHRIFVDVGLGFHVEFTWQSL